MFKKSIKYTDFNGNEQTEEAYFHFSEAELFQMQGSVNGGLSEQLRRLNEMHDYAALAEFFQTFILKAYGVKSDDGRRFIKSEQLSTEFSQTEAYSNLYMELATDSNAAQKFINNLIPAKMRDRAAALVDNANN